MSAIGILQKRAAPLPDNVSRVSCHMNLAHSPTRNRNLPLRGSEVADRDVGAPSYSSPASPLAAARNKLTKVLA